ncbi:hypothetical protein FNB79_10860 [Formosa sediminum]|uniref:Uncharacterized protein n=1 Tax=Formosa sediminum TaxID=2594004 RepID=A0A516GSE8_9FLAO|nr:hypothetical protein [Formosa sediminum]QDO94442.1 hypothetical protein FNB79_10860 [Formosa sediminum]
MINNIEYGVHFSKTLFNPTDKLFEETEAFTYKLVFEESHVVYLKKPQYKRKMMGITKAYQNSKTLYDISENFFWNADYEIKFLKEFDFENVSDLEKFYKNKPKRQISEDDNKQAIQQEHKLDPEYGYCIRTGVEIPYNPKQPMCYNAWKIWNKYGYADFPEKYCHKTGKPSEGKTSMANPILEHEEVSSR